MATKENYIPLEGYHSYDETEMIQRSRWFYEQVRRRRTVRDFSSEPVPMEVIRWAIQAAGTAPNGANLQPWHFVVISDSQTKSKIRLAAEEEEREFYNRRASQEWLEALEPLGVDEFKPFLEKAPTLIAIFSKSYEVNDDGSKTKTYYPTESIGIATGMLITALHHAGVATLTHTPSPMRFLNQILDRPNNERPFLLLVVGYPEASASVPKISKKTLDEIATFI